MNPDMDIYTETMARVYAQQGHWSKAVEIYRRLTEKEPGRQDLAQALADAEKKVEKFEGKAPAQLVPLFQEWIELMLKYEKLKKLKQLQNRP